MNTEPMSLPVVILYEICTAEPAHALAYSPFIRSLRFSGRKTLLFVTLNEFCRLGCIALAVVSGHAALLRYIQYLFGLVSMAQFFYNVRVDRFKLLFNYVFVMDYVVVAKGLAVSTTVVGFHQPTYSWVGVGVILAVQVLLLPPMVMFFHRTARRVFDTDAPALWRCIWLAPALTSVMVLMSTDAFSTESVSHPYFLFARLVGMVSMFVVYYVLLQSLESVRRQGVLEERANQSEHILAFQRMQYKQLQEHMEEIRRARHDLRQHLNMIQSFLNCDDERALRNYMEAHSGILSADPPRRYCRNFAVNALLNFYKDSFKTRGIEADLEAVVPERLSVAEPDLCVMLGNLLENAQEACAGQESPYIRVAIRAEESGPITLIVDNTAAQPPVCQEDGTFASTKHPGTGIGTRSVRHIAEQYGGKAQFRWENGMFCASVFLNPAAQSGTAL